MNKYFLQRLNYGRVILDGTLYPEAELIDTIEANNWLDARSKVMAEEFDIPNDKNEFSL